MLFCMAMETKSKYQTGMYYKACLFADNEEWSPSGSGKSASGLLRAAVAINKASLLAEVAIYDQTGYSELIDSAKRQLAKGFDKLEIDDREKELFNVLYQTPRITKEIPITKEYSDPGLSWSKLKAALKRLVTIQR